MEPNWYDAYSNKLDRPGFTKETDPRVPKKAPSDDVNVPAFVIGRFFKRLRDKLRRNG